MESHVARVTFVPFTFTIRSPTRRPLRSAIESNIRFVAEKKTRLRDGHKIKRSLAKEISLLTDFHLADLTRAIADNCEAVAARRRRVRVIVHLLTSECNLKIKRKKKLKLKLNWKAQIDKIKRSVEYLLESIEIDAEVVAVVVVVVEIRLVGCSWRCLCGSPCVWRSGWGCARPSERAWRTRSWLPSVVVVVVARLWSVASRRWWLLWTSRWWSSCGSLRNDDDGGGGDGACSGGCAIVTRCFDDDDATWLFERSAAWSDVASSASPSPRTLWTTTRTRTRKTTMTWTIRQRASCSRTLRRPMCCGAMCARRMLAIVAYLCLRVAYEVWLWLIRVEMLGVYVLTR